VVEAALSIPRRASSSGKPTAAVAPIVREPSRGPGTSRSLTKRQPQLANNTLGARRQRSCRVGGQAQGVSSSGGAELGAYARSRRHAAGVGGERIRARRCAGGASRSATNAAGVRSACRQPAPVPARSRLIVRSRRRRSCSSGLPQFNGVRSTWHTPWCATRKPSKRAATSFGKGEIGAARQRECGVSGRRSKISFPRRRWPASDAASCVIPSIRSPSPQIGKTCGGPQSRAPGGL